jgi:hypothetical protein
MQYDAIFTRREEISAAYKEAVSLATAQGDQTRITYRVVLAEDGTPAVSDTTPTSEAVAIERFGALDLLYHGINEMSPEEVERHISLEIDNLSKIHKDDSTLTVWYLCNISSDSIRETLGRWIERNADMYADRDEYDEETARRARNQLSALYGDIYNDLVGDDDQINLARVVSDLIYGINGYCDTITAITSDPETWAQYADGIRAYVAAAWPDKTVDYDDASARGDIIIYGVYNDYLRRLVHYIAEEETWYNERQIEDLSEGAKPPRS